MKHVESKLFNQNGHFYFSYILEIVLVETPIGVS